MLWLKCKMPFRKHLTLVKIKKNFSEYVEKRVFPENEYKKYIEPKPFTFIPAFPPILTPTVNQKVKLNIFIIFNYVYI